MALPPKPYLPNTGLIINDPTGSVNLGANADTILLDVSRVDIFGIDLQGTFTATLSWTCSVDNITFFQLNPYSTLGGTSTAGSTGTTNQQLFFNTAGLSVLKLSITAYTSGTINITWNAVDSNVGRLIDIGQLTPGTGPTNIGKAEDAVAANGDVGVFMLGVRDDAGTTVPTSTTGDYSQLTLNGQGHLYVQPGISASTGNRPTRFRQIAAATTNATSIKGSAGNLFALVVNNTSAAVKYLKLYDKATAPTVGTDTPVLVIGVPATSSFQFDLGGFAMAFTLGIASATTGLGTDADATALAASDLSFTLFYF